MLSKNFMTLSTIYAHECTFILNSFSYLLEIPEVKLISLANLNGIFV